MRFWDSSALVPLIVEEAASRRCRDLRRANPRVGVWTLTRTEVVSALRRREREGEIGKTVMTAALRRLSQLEQEWEEVEDVPSVRTRAEALLARHVLRAADALQLGAALLLVDDKPRRRPFVTLDDRLGAAAEAEGFDVEIPLA